MSLDERPVDDTLTPARALADELRALRRSAGDPGFAKMASLARGRVSKTAMSDAVAGKHVPKWDTVEAFVDVCGADPELLRPSWERARLRNTPQAPNLLTAVSGDAKRWRWRWPVLLVIVTAALTGTLTAMTLASFHRDPVVHPVVRPIAALVVQNKIAVGPADLLEDPSGPAYLSGRTESFCAARGCKVRGTELDSGAVVAVTCRTDGEPMVNYNADSVPVQDNPGRIRSVLWYRVVFPDGRSGFLSEVYVAPEYRGGMGLGTCP
ncbi:helix-turn-helix domain-containing protein [Actinoplanes sp. NPDC051494]|uniref:helix-turn-helix domain-containing protein n=1 Tax=Actinoplanes sp. NPDC051494 TaxID=3363907 RepID=UPI0037AA7C7E